MAGRGYVPARPAKTGRRLGHRNFLNYGLSLKFEISITKWRAYRLQNVWVSTKSNNSPGCTPPFSTVDDLPPF